MIFRMVGALKAYSAFMDNRRIPAPKMTSSGLQHLTHSFPSTISYDLTTKNVYLIPTTWDRPKSKFQRSFIHIFIHIHIICIYIYIYIIYIYIIYLLYLYYIICYYILYYIISILYFILLYYIVHGYPCYPHDLPKMLPATISAIQPSIRRCCWRAYWARSPHWPPASSCWPCWTFCPSEMMGDGARREPGGKWWFNGI